MVWSMVNVYFSYGRTIIDWSRVENEPAKGQPASYNQNLSKKEYYWIFMYSNDIFYLTVW